MNVKDWLKSVSVNPPSSISSVRDSGIILPAQYQGEGFNGHSVSNVNGIPVAGTDVLDTGSAARYYYPSERGDLVYSNDTSKSVPRGLVPARGARTRFHDPLSLVYATGFKDRRFSLSYETLRRTVNQLSLIGAVILTRVNQVASFAQPFRDNKQLGFEVRFNDELYNPSDDQRNYLKRIEKFIMNCGWGKNAYSSAPRDDFETFLKKIVRDSLTFDQACWVAGSLVELVDGDFVKIEDIKSGMQVRSHLGSTKKVIMPTSRMYSGEMCDISVCGQKLRVTAGHPLLLVDALDKELVPEWKSAVHVHKGMCLVYPKLKSRGEFLNVDYNKVVDNGEDSYFQKLQVDQQLGSLLGLYYACGVKSEDSISFQFPEKLSDLRYFLIRLLEQYRIQYVQSEVVGKHVVHILNLSHELVKFILKVVGDSIPSCIFNAKKSVRHAFIKMVLERLSCCDEGRLRVRCRNYELFLGLRCLLSGEGFYLQEDFTGCWNREVGCEYLGLVQDLGVMRRFSLQMMKDGVVSRKKKNVKVVDTEDYLYLMVDDVVVSFVEDERVFNMEVEDDHSYIAEGVASHNCFEIVPDQAGRPFEFKAVDAGTIRLAATYDGHRGDTPPKFNVKDFSERWQGEYGEDDIQSQIDDVFTVQVIYGRIENIYTANDMAFCVRNSRSDIWANNYGLAETEICLNTVTRMLWAEEYNARNFQQGSMANGIMNLKGEQVDPAQLESFRRMWQARVVGVENSFRMPIMQVPEGIELVNLQRPNKDMEYRAWLDYLLKIVTGVFQIDPSEINFDLVSGSGGRSGPLFESKHEWKIKYSKDKGLRPLLKFLAKQISKYVIEPLDDRLLFDFVGLDQQSETDKVELIQRQVSTYVTVNEVRVKEGYDPIPGGDVVLNPIVLQAQQQEMQMQQQRVGDSKDNNPLAPWMTQEDVVQRGYGEALAVPLILQKGESKAMTGGSLEGMPLGGMPPEGMPPEGMPPEGGAGV